MKKPKVVYDPQMPPYMSARLPTATSGGVAVDARGAAIDIDRAIRATAPPIMIDVITDPVILELRVPFTRYKMQLRCSDGGNKE